jgi:AcrR family transcriptional regulator
MPSKLHPQLDKEVLPAMTYAAFSKTAALSQKTICLESLAQNRLSIRIKKEQTAVKNLEKIFAAVLKISYKKGFQAMSMRELSGECGLSMGALYAYFSSKDQLLEMLQNQRRSITQRILHDEIAARSDARSKLEAAIRTHLYLSETMQPWFYFSFMEAKNLNKVEREKAVASDVAAEKMYENIIIQGQAEGIFCDCPAQLIAGMILAMLQDWYLKRGKFAKRNVDVDQYANAVLQLVEAYIAIKGGT